MPQPATNSDAHRSAPIFYVDTELPTPVIERRLRDAYPLATRWVRDTGNPHGWNNVNGWAYDAGGAVVCRVLHRPRAAEVEVHRRYIVGKWGNLQIRDRLPRILAHEGRVMIEWSHHGHAAGGPSFWIKGGRVVEARSMDDERIVCRPFPESVADELATADAEVARCEAALQVAKAARQAVLEGAVARSAPLKVER